MSIKRRVPKQESNYEHVEGDFENLKPKEFYEARLTYVVDCGLHYAEYKGERKSDVQKLALGFEIVDHEVQIGGEMQPRLLWLNPFNIYSTLTEKGHEIKYYSVFDASADDGDEPDWDAQLGKPCELYVTHTPKKGDDTIVYDTISDVRSIPAKYQDGVTKGQLESGVGSPDDQECDAVKRLFGLAEYVYNNRLDDDVAPYVFSKSSSSGNTPPAEFSKDDPDMDGFDSDDPF